MSDFANISRSATALIEAVTDSGFAINPEEVYNMCEVVKGIYNAGKEEGREEMRAERYSESLARAEALSDKIPDDLLSQATGVSQKDINVLRKKGKLILFKITNTCDVMSQVFRKDQGSAAY